MEQTLTSLPIERLTPSPTNPRKHFNKKADEELRASIEKAGVKVPLTVRQLNNRNYEVVCGGRRHREAGKCGLKELPCIVEALTDVEVIELQSIENLNRADIHPLDEAESYKLLMKQAKYTTQQIADKVGKTPGYITQRMKLVDLSEDWKKEFLEDRLALGPALLIARLQEKEQRGVAAFFKQRQRFGDTVTTENLRTFIEEEFYLDLHKSSFPKNDALLMPGTPACQDCPKRTGFNEELFNDIARKDTCTDPKCFNAKCDAHLTQQRKKLEDSKGEGTMGGFLELSNESNYALSKPDPEKHIPRNLYFMPGEAGFSKKKKTQKGIVVNGIQRGRIVDVQLKEPERQITRKKTKAQVEEEKKRQEREKLEELVDEKLTLEVAKHLPKKLSREDWLLLYDVLADAAYFDDDPLQLLGLKAGFNWKKADLPTLQKLVLLNAIIERSKQDFDLLRDAAVRYGVDVKAVEKECKMLRQAQQPESAATEKSPVPPEDGGTPPLTRGTPSQEGTKTKKGTKRGKGKKAKATGAKKSGEKIRNSVRRRKK